MSNPAQRKTNKVYEKANVSILVNDSSAEEYINDLRGKCNQVAKRLISKELWPRQGLISRAVLKVYLETVGMLSAASETSSQAYYFKAAIILDVINRILDDAGVELKVSVAPKSLMESYYQQLFKEEQTPNE